MEPSFAAWTEMHRVNRIGVVELLTKACARINSNGLKYNAEDRQK